MPFGSKKREVAKKKNNDAVVIASHEDLAHKHAHNHDNNDESNTKTLVHTQIRAFALVIISFKIREILSSFLIMLRSCVG